MNAETRAELARLLDEATPGEWYYGSPVDETEPVSASDYMAGCLAGGPGALARDLHLVWAPGVRVIALTGDGPKSEVHSQLIWLMRDALPGLLADSEALADARAKLAAVRAYCEAFNDEAGEPFTDPEPWNPAAYVLAILDGSAS